MDQPPRLWDIAVHDGRKSRLSCGIIRTDNIDRMLPVSGQRAYKRQSSLAHLWSLDLARRKFSLSLFFVFFFSFFFSLTLVSPQCFLVISSPGIRLVGLDSVRGEAFWKSIAGYFS